MISSNGFENLQWFIGIVEDNQDPVNQGRVRVRCFGVHPPYDSGEVETQDLPWAIPINGSYNGLSQIPRVSDWVFGFFVDGRDSQHPMLLGTIPGQNLQHHIGSGKQNASGYVKPTEESYQKTGHQALHPAQSGEGLEDTQVTLQNASLVTTETAKESYDIENSIDSRGWSEPPTTISGEPHKTTVWSSRYGESYIEINGSDNNESINISHTSGSQIQIDQQGNIKLKSFGDMYSISEGHTREYTEGRRDLTIEGKYTINVVDGDCTLEVGGNLNHVVHGDYSLNVAGRMALSAGLGFELAAARATMETTAEHFNLISAEKIKVRSEDTTSIHSGNKMFIDSDSSIDMISNSYMRSHSRFTNHLTSDQSASISSFGSNVFLTAASVIAEDAPGGIYLNSGVSIPGDPSIDTPEIAVSPKVDLPTQQKIVSSGNQAGVITDNHITPSPSQGGIGSHAVDDHPSSDVPVETSVDPNETIDSFQGDNDVDTNIPSGEGLETLLAFISEGEGGYQASNRGTANGRIIGSTQNTIRDGKSLIELTFREIFQYQQITDPFNEDRLFAIGRYQIIPSTLRTVFKASGLSLDDKFSEENQDILGTILIIGSNGYVKRPELASYIRGTSSDLQAAMLDFAKEFASAPDPRTGNSYYGSGNKASHTVGDVASALKQARTDFLQQDGTLV